MSAGKLGKDKSGHMLMQFLAITITTVNQSCLKPIADRGKERKGGAGIRMEKLIKFDVAD